MAAATGDTYVYRISNGYNNEVRGKISYRVDKADADRIEVAVTTDTPSAGARAPRSTRRTATGCATRSPTTISCANTNSRRHCRFTRRRATPADRGRCASTRSIRRPARARACGSMAKCWAASASPCPPAPSIPSRSGAASMPAIGTASSAKPTYVEIDWYAPALGRSVKTRQQIFMAGHQPLLARRLSVVSRGLEHSRTRRNQRAQALIPRDIEQAQRR